MKTYWNSLKGKKVSKVMKNIFWDDKKEFRVWSDEECERFENWKEVRRDDLENFSKDYISGSSISKVFEKEDDPLYGEEGSYGELGDYV